MWFTKQPLVYPTKLQPGSVQHYIHGHAVIAMWFRFVLFYTHTQPHIHPHAHTHTHTHIEPWSHQQLTPVIPEPLMILGYGYIRVITSSSHYLGNIVSGRVSLSAKSQTRSHTKVFSWDWLLAAHCQMISFLQYMTLHPLLLDIADTTLCYLDTLGISFPSKVFPGSLLTFGSSTPFGLMTYILFSSSALQTSSAAFHHV